MQWRGGMRIVSVGDHAYSLINEGRAENDPRASPPRSASPAESALTSEARPASRAVSLASTQVRLLATVSLS